tara:strand:+ start:1173 stop:1631 length:459 start_codon:yes stop_codon:yes gene_type:complete
MSSSIENLPNSDMDNNMDPDVNNILNSLQNDYEENNMGNENNNYMDNYNQDFDSNNNFNQNIQENNLNSENSENSENLENSSLFNNILHKCREPLIVLVVVLIINNNFTFSLFKNIPQLTTDGVLNIIGYCVIALMSAVAFFMLNIVSTQML